MPTFKARIKLIIYQVIQTCKYKVSNNYLQFGDRKSLKAIILAKTIIKFYQMQRPKLQSHFRPHHRKYEELTPKIPAKTPINFRQRKLAGQSSALPANRVKSKDINYFNIQRPTNRLESIHKDKSVLSEQQIKSSTLYRLLEEEMTSLAKRQQAEIQKMQQVKKAKQKQLSEIKNEQHAIKLQIWELRNQTMELKDSIKEQKQQTQRLMEELGITQEDLENRNTQQQEGQQQNQEESENQNQPST